MPLNSACRLSPVRLLFHGTMITIAELPMLCAAMMHLPCDCSQYSLCSNIASWDVLFCATTVSHFLRHRIVWGCGVGNFVRITNELLRSMPSLMSKSFKDHGNAFWEVLEVMSAVWWGRLSGRLQSWQYFIAWIAVYYLKLISRLSGGVDGCSTAWKDLWTFWVPAERRKLVCYVNWCLLACTTLLTNQTVIAYIISVVQRLSSVVQRLISAHLTEKSVSLQASELNLVLHTGLRLLHQDLNGKQPISS